MRFTTSLGVISSPPADVQPVLDAIVKTAATLCNSYNAVILLKDTDDLLVAAHHGPMALDFERLPLIGPRKGRRWHREPERFGGLEVDQQPVLRRRLHR